MSKNKAAITRGARRRKEVERRGKAENQIEDTKIITEGQQPWTFGEVMDRLGLLAKTSKATRDIIQMTGAAAEELARKSLKVISCHSCTAPKGCCTFSTMAYLYEVVPLAARLLREGRDTEDLRAQLAAAADRMENTPARAIRRPCVFLDPQERCTVYEDRPSACGSHFVFSEPALCSSSDPGAHTEKITWPHQNYLPKFEQRFAAEAKLRQIDVPYVGALPRMVLVCLQAWNRVDYSDFIANECRHRTAKFLRAAAGPRTTRTST